MPFIWFATQFKQKVWGICLMVGAALMAFSTFFWQGSEYGVNVAIMRGRRLIPAVYLGWVLFTSKKTLLNQPAINSRGRYQSGP